ncbi:FAD-dependent oxidoreductase [Agromyces bauzanensis]|uniref:Fused response regulator/thioredoxin-disulfide reductase n=1 Tax=Agromyces bauzanensis TaxID=1308924 RepID=A0A917PK53_9MICO|nr:FAD-dependent oxidoreductase [Agromyces bauzanensis]GGJ82446.1 fused response regulator/thioredoxin-disulfide reductase [Agromyces bauzanensis]
MDARDHRQPAILVVAADPGARAAVLEPLGRRYSADYRILDADVPARAVEVIDELHAAGGDLALVLADDASPVAGHETAFAAARRHFPDVRRGLVIEWGAWADRTTAQTVLELMSHVQIDYYVLRPVHSPDESFHRAVTDFLREWEAAVGKRHRGFTVIGDDVQPRTHVLRSLLARGGVPTEHLEPDAADAMALLAEAGVDYGGAPLVRTADGRVLVDPDDAALARAYGLDTSLPDGTVDLAVVGAGPAGLAAAVYAASEGLDTLVLEGESIGGQAGSSSLIRNYLGFSRGVSGSELAQRAYQQAWVFGARFAHTRRVAGLRIVDGGFELDVAPDGDVVRARAVVLATGVSYRRLSAPGLQPFVGASVFYGASSVEARAQSGRDVLVVGGGNSAGQAALHLARYARTVSLVVRGDSLAASMSRYLIDQLDAAGVGLITGSRVVDAGAAEADRLDHVVLERVDSGERLEVPAAAVFITIGARPHTEWLPPEVLRDRWGSVITGPDVLAEGGRRAWLGDEGGPSPLETSVPGCFAVGDARRGSVKRVASAVGEGSVVVSSVHAHLGPHAGG